MGLTLMLLRYVWDSCLVFHWLIVQTVIKDLRKEGPAQRRVSNAPAAE